MKSSNIINALELLTGNFHEKVSHINDRGEANMVDINNKRI